MGIDFAHPWAFALLAAPILFRLLVPARAATAAIAAPAPVIRVLAALQGPGATIGLGRAWSLAFAGAGWLALVTAFAGPYAEGREILRPSGRDLLLALDLSASMGKPDLEREGRPVSRFEVMQERVGAFLESRAGDRVGVIAFAERAFLIAPLTHDVAAAPAYLEEMTVGMPGRKTSLGVAIGMALNVFAGAPDNARVLVILSDGEDNAGDLPSLAAARLAAERGVRIHAIAFGADIDAHAGGAQGLRRIAEIGGGALFTADGVEALAEVYDRLSALEPASAGALGERIRQDLTRWALIAACLCLAPLTLMRSAS